MKHPLLAIILLSAAICAHAADYKREIHINPDGSGDFTTIAESFEAIRAYMDYDVNVYIAPGVYREKIVVPSWIQNVHFIGEDPETTVITWDDHANINKMGTFRTYTVRVDANNVTFEGITIENNAPRLGQAVALHTEGDNLTFTRCRLLGNQDTVFTGGRGTELRFYDCYIEGTTDFIFGQATALFKDCEICCKSDSYITAASTPADVEIGYVFDGCHISAVPEVKQVYLGRPWRPYAYTAFIDCVIDAPIHKARWHNWKNPDNELTARYSEYGTSGASSDTSAQVSWTTPLTSEQVQQIRAHFMEVPAETHVEESTSEADRLNAERR